MASNIQPAKPMSSNPQNGDKNDISVDVEALPSSENVTHNMERIERAKLDSAMQAELTVKEGIRKYRDAVLWSALMTLVSRPVDCNGAPLLAMADVSDCSNGILRLWPHRFPLWIPSVC